MASNAIAGVGTEFKISDMASSPVFTKVAEVNNIGGPNISVDTIDVTNLDSTSGYREFIAGFIDGGEITLGMNFTRDEYIQFLDLVNARAKFDAQIAFPDTGNTTLDMSVLVTALGVETPTDDKVTQSVTMKVSGPVTPSS